MEWKSVRMMKFPRYGKIAFMFQTTNQEVTWSGSNPWLPSNMAGKFTSWRTMEVYFAKSFNDMGIFCPASHGNHIGWVYSWGYPLVNIHIAIFHISIASWFTQLFSLWWIFPVRKLSTLRVFHVPQLLDVDVTGTQLWLGARFAPSESSALHCFG